MIPYVMPTQTLTRGDIWEDVYHIGPMVADVGGSLPATCLSCRMQFRNVHTEELGYELSSDPAVGEGTITIVDAVNYEFNIAAQELPLEKGIWKWDFETFTELLHVGPSRTWLKGTFIIKEDASHD